MLQEDISMEMLSPRLFMETFWEQEVENHSGKSIF